MDSKLIVESGSTKTDWVIINSDASLKYTTQGMNPSASEDFFDLNEEIKDLNTFSPKIKSIHFFGAGIIDDHTQSLIKNWLATYFKNCEAYQIESDMLGAAISTAGSKRGIICILGTGSNSCVYDGLKIIDNIPALGFALSNEGGGSKIGSELIKAYFYRQLPADVHNEFSQEYNVTKSDLVEHVYKCENPTAYLANYAQFLNKTRNKKWRKEFLMPLFQEFIDVRIKQYSEYLSYDLHFVGSIAYFYADLLKEVLQNNNLSSTSIIPKPIDGLIDYFK